MPAHRILFRLDFRVNFRILNNLGEVLEIIDTIPPKKFWSNYKTNSQDYTASGYFKSPEKDLVRIITVQPNAIVGILETAAGFEIDQVFTNDTFKTLMKIVKEICTKYKIDEIQRAGLRLFHFNNVAENPENVQEAFQQLFDSRLTKKIETELGKINDVGVIFEGEHEDKIKYLYRFGPCFPNESKRYLEELSKEFEENNKFNIVFDLDLYEKNFSLSNIPLSKRFQPLFIRADQTIKQTEDLITKIVES